MAIRSLWPLLALVAPSVWAQQQTPPQHSPAVHDYEEMLPSEKLLRDRKTEKETAALKKETDETLNSDNSKVTLTWYPIARATRYLLMIARDSDMNSTFFTIETIQTAYVTPSLPPGQYYYQIQGFEGERAVGKTTLQRFVVGRPLELTAREKKQRLQAPTIVGPKHMELFPAYGKVRVAWQAVDGARGYRFRLWDEDKVKNNNRWKKDTPPRWVTEVKQPWLEILDAPYASYMYLTSGLYRWDVAAIDKDGGFVGNPAMGYFRVSSDWHLKPVEFYWRLQYGLSPNISYLENSAITGQGYELSGATGHRIDADFDWWFARIVGMNVGFGTETFVANAPAYTGAAPLEKRLGFYHFNLDLMYRQHLSRTPWGWTMILGLGLGLQEFAQVSRIVSGEMTVDYPKALGAKLGFRFNHRWLGPWEMQIQGNHLFHAFTLASPGPAGAVTSGTFDGDLTLRAVHHWGPHFATSLGLTGEYRRLMYIPQPFLQHSEVVFPNWYILLGAQFHYYPIPQNNPPDTDIPTYNKVSY